MMESQRTDTEKIILIEENKRKGTMELLDKMYSTKQVLKKYRKHKSKIFKN